MSATVDALLKRSFDFVASVMALVILFPAFILIAILIKATSRGPVFYRGVRTGRNGREFRVFKFRTMVKDAESLGGPSTGLADPRVTAVGSVLRKFKLDELPNLLNVALGQMSLVGPRPEVPRYTALYAGDEKLILTVRPGITDLSSVRYIDLASHIGSTNVDENFEKHVLPEKNRLRVEYVKTRSFVGDLKIIAATFHHLIFRGSRKHAIR